MDIQVSSNFERLLFEAYDRDAPALARADERVSRNRSASRSPARRSPKSAQVSPPAAPARTKSPPPCARPCARPAHFVDPHTAVGIAVAEKEPRDPALPMVVLSTAHAAKFPDAVEEACGARPTLPDWLSDLNERQRARRPVLPADQKQIEDFVLAASRAAREGAAA